MSKLEKIVNSITKESDESDKIAVFCKKENTKHFKNVNTEKKECLNDQKYKVESSEATTEESVDLKEENITKSLKGIIGDQHIFRHLCLHIFTESDLMNCTRTGKRTIKCMGDVKPALNTCKFDLLERMVLSHTNLDKATFIKKFENLQKILRRNSKE